VMLLLLFVAILNFPQKALHFQDYLLE